MGQRPGCAIHNHGGMAGESGEGHKRFESPRPWMFQGRIAFPKWLWGWLGGCTGETDKKKKLAVVGCGQL